MQERLMTKKYIAIIYEGEKTERQLVDNLNKVFFKDLSELIPIMFPAGENIYMLWKQLKEDEFETDLIEVIREYNSDAEKALHGFHRNDFMEIYLFFDYDGHQNNLGCLESNCLDVLDEMLDTFSEETESGKLYINYPMVESLRDNKPPSEENCYRKCTVRLDEIKNYKRTVTDIHIYQDFRKLDRRCWNDLCINAVCKTNCIINNVYGIPKRKDFIENMGQNRLYQEQKDKYITDGKIAVVNSFPLFLLEYFKKEFWDEIFTQTKSLYSDNEIQT